ELFSAHTVEGGVRVMVTEEFARGWDPAFRMLESIYRRNSIVHGLHWPRPVMMRRACLRKMFPDGAGWRGRGARRTHYVPGRPRCAVAIGDVPAPASEGARRPRARRPGVGPVDQR